jgi:hypothetical protein
MHALTSTCSWFIQSDRNFCPLGEDGLSLIIDFALSFCPQVAIASTAMSLPTERRV